MKTATTAAGRTPAHHDPCDPEFWRLAWRQARDGSILKCSQKASPQAWRDFYAQVSSSYLAMWGQGGELGRRVVEEMARQDLLWPGQDLLDVGCGPGTLTLPLAAAGARVTALDWCGPMLATMEHTARAQGLNDIRPLCRPWDHYRPDREHDLVLASFFPDALSVAGLERLEGWSAGRVALVLGTGEEGFAFRRQLWRRVLEVPYHDGGFHLTCALGWLNASGRHPNLRHLAWPVDFDHPLDTVFHFYKHYFAIFGRGGVEVEEDIRTVLEQWRQGERLRAQGRVSLALLWWEAPKPAVRG